MRDALLLLVALVANVAGMGWLALAMDVHWQQVYGDRLRTSARAGRLRVLGTLALAASLVLCLVADHASMASLVWVMALAAAALVITLTLTWRARWLRLLVPWVRETSQA